MVRECPRVYSDKRVNYNGRKNMYLQKEKESEALPLAFKKKYRRDFSRCVYDCFNSRIPSKS